MRYDQVSRCHSSELAAVENQPYSTTLTIGDCDTRADSTKNPLDLRRSRNSQWKQDDDCVRGKKEEQQREHTALDLRDPKKPLLQSAKTTPEAFKGLEVGFIYPQSMPHYRYYVVGWSYECALYCLLFVRQESRAFIAAA